MKTKNLINLAKVSLFSLGLFMTSCSNESFDELPNPVGEQPQLIEKFFLGESIQVEDLGEGLYLHDDVIFTEDQLTDSAIDFNKSPEPGTDEDQKLGLAGGVRKWPNNTVIYVLDNSLTSNQIQVTLNSMQEWSTKTNVRFKERTNENYYVTIRNNGNTCNCGSANLGVIGDRGRINIGTRTSEVVMIHEIGHTLGYIHEQNRSDRDDHVIIRFENIQDGAESQFRKSNSAQLIGDFDIQSTMMYGAFTFSKNGQPTITLLDGSTHPRRQPRLSAGDIAGTNQVYPGDGGGGDGGGDNDICAGVEEWVRGRQYNVGDRVTYQGFLYERDFTRWNRIGQCENTNPNPADICEGVEPYNRSRRYSPGDEVTYQGFLYELQSNFRWANQGRCGN